MLRPLTLLIVAFPLVSPAQEPSHQPIPAIARILAAPPIPAVLISPVRSKLLILERPGLLPIAEVASPELRLAGARINPRSNALSRLRTFGTMIVQPIPTGDPRRIVIPWHSRVGGAVWSPDGSRVAFTLIEEGGVSLWLADAASGTIRMLSPPNLNGAFGQPCRWMPWGDALLCLRIPADRPPTRVRAATPVSSVAPESGVESSDLLQNAQDEELFERYFASQLVLIPISGKDRPVGGPGIHSDVQVSPNGQYLLVQTIHRPFSYRVPWERFPRRTEVWDLSGTVLKLIADAELLEKLAGADGAEPGPRSVGWRPDTAAMLSWVEAGDGGDPAVEARVRDRLMVLDAPFSATPAAVAELEYRCREVLWGNGLGIVSERWQKSGRFRSWVVDARRRDAPRLLGEGERGRWLTQPGPSGPQLVMSRDRRFVFLQEAGESPEGARPFLDQLELATGKTVRLWRSEGPYYEEVAALLNPESGLLLTRRESSSEPANYFVRQLRKARPAQLTQITNFTDPAPEFASISRQVIRYKPAEGVELSGRLYLPPGYEKSRGRIPFLLYFGAPGSPYRFVRPSGPSHLLLPFAGYGVLDGLALPTRRRVKEAPESYLRRVVASAEAAAAKLIAVGVGDPQRIALGGQAPDATLTALVLAHSDRFRAGIVRNGASDGPTTGGLESEGMSDAKLKAPLLLIQGTADDSSGTFPSELERLYLALKDQGATLRLVVIPGERHGYAARESAWEVMYEMVEWLGRYLR